MRRKLQALASALLLVAISALFAVAAQGPPSYLIYAHDRLYTGVNAPNDLPEQGDFNAIYPLGPGLHAVSEAAPGDRDYRGGRWEVRPVSFLTIAPRQFTNAVDLVAAAARGEIGIGAVVKRFECPLIPINPNRP
jgi:hypothetical protein